MFIEYTCFELVIISEALLVSRPAWFFISQPARLVLCAGLIVVTLVFALDVHVCVFSARLFSFPCVWGIWFEHP